MEVGKEYKGLKSKEWEELPLNLGAGSGGGRTPEAPLISDDPRRPFLRQASTHLSTLTKDPRKAPRLIKSIIGEYSQGWRFGVLCSSILGSVIAIINLALTIWTFTALPVDGTSVFNGVVTIHEGRCGLINSGNTVIKLMVNIFATLLLAGSNFCMQVLSSPSRNEVDRAHKRNRWLTIGLPNFTNLRYIDNKRTILWLFLASSSIPLHLLWNSAFVVTLSVNNYISAAVPQNFGSGIDFVANTTQYGPGLSAVDARILKDVWKNATFVNLTVPDCIKTYGQSFLTDYSNVGLVYDIPHSDHGLIWAQQTLNAFDTRWVCGSQNWNETCAPLRVARHNQTTWTPFQFNATEANFSYVEPLMQSHVNYCLAQKVERPCKLSATPTILLVVFIANVMKVLGYVGTLWVADRRSPPIVTTGDAIQSFLNEPDTNFSGRCLTTASQAKRKAFWTRDNAQPHIWHPKARRWLDGASLSLWLLAYLPALGFWGAIVGISTEQLIFREGFDGFGSPSLNQVISKGSSNDYGILSATLIANSPQIVTSYCYCAFNALLSSIIANEEWTNFTLRHKGLRVTDPVGEQRRTYYHDLPRRYALPFLAVSALLHWIVSESLFLVRSVIYKYDGSLDTSSMINAVGESPEAIAVFIAVFGALLVMFVVVAAMRKYSSRSPLAACCSASIAAACQPLNGTQFEKDLATRALRWGVVNDMSSLFEGIVELGIQKGVSDLGTAVGVQHATFSASLVAPLREGQAYS